MKAESIQKPKGVTEMDTPPHNVSRVNKFSVFLIELYKKDGVANCYPIESMKLFL